MALEENIRYATICLGQENRVFYNLFPDDAAQKDFKYLKNTWRRSTSRTEAIFLAEVLISKNKNIENDDGPFILLYQVCPYPDSAGFNSYGVPCKSFSSLRNAYETIESQIVGQNVVEKYGVRIIEEKVEPDIDRYLVVHEYTHRVMEYCVYLKLEDAEKDLERKTNENSHPFTKSSLAEILLSAELRKENEVGPFALVYDDRYSKWGESCEDIPCMEIHNSFSSLLAAYDMLELSDKTDYIKPFATKYGVRIIKEVERESTGGRTT
jgi:hypothetical protein